jgi:hypothetical protein
MNNSLRLPRIVALLAAGALLASSGAAMAADPARVGGTVLDAATGKPLQGVVVRIKDGSGMNRHVLTDKHGRYTIIGLESGRVALDAELQLHATATGTFSVPPGDSITCDFRLMPIETMSTTRTGAIRTDHPKCQLDPQTVDKITVQ